MTKNQNDFDLQKKHVSHGFVKWHDAFCINEFLLMILLKLTIFIWDRSIKFEGLQVQDQEPVNIGMENFWIMKTVIVIFTDVYSTWTKIQTCTLSDIKMDIALLN